MNKKPLMLIIIAIVVVSLGIWFFINLSGSNQQQTETTPRRNDTETTSNMAPETIVQYTNKGFTPSQVTVKLGDTVTFINSSDSIMWVASNPHPTHTDYPAFDELTSVEAGGVYKFTFTKTGTWGYHNHMDHTQTGKVIVIN